MLFICLFTVFNAKNKERVDIFTIFNKKKEEEVDNRRSHSHCSLLIYKKQKWRREPGQGL